MNLIAVQEQDSAPHRKLCTDCGISRTSEPGRCGYACQFINPDYARLEHQTHGRVRQTEGDVEPFSAWSKRCTKRRSHRNVTARSGPASPHDWEKRY